MSRKSRLRALRDRQHWLIPYLFPKGDKRTPKPDDGPKHILFSFVDHFEPGHGKADSAVQLARVEHWHRRYPEIVRSFKDSGGHSPRHTWFYLGEEPAHLHRLGELCFQGFGEIELHIHHGSKENIPEQWKHNSLDTLGRYIEKQLNFFSQYGALITAEGSPKRVFGFLHGMFALDNSLPEYCGVPGELKLLRKLGCYGDFTFPAPGKSQPPITNRHYYPTGNPGKGSSYFQGEEIKVGSERREAVLIFQGPLGLVRQGMKIKVEDGHLDWNLLPTHERVHFWISKGIHVKGRPEWIFIKVYIHGAMERNVEEFLGAPMAKLHQVLGELSHENPPLILHYVTARESFNIAMAAMAGKVGDPGEFRNFLIPPYANTLIYCNRPYRLEGYFHHGWSLQLLDSKEVYLKVKGDLETEVKGESLEEIRLYRNDQREGVIFQARGRGKIDGIFKNIKKKEFIGERRSLEGVVNFSPLPKDLGVSYSGSFSSEGLLKFEWDFPR